MKLAFHRGGLARRLVLTYLGLALVVGSLFTLGALWSIDTLEARLQRIDMGMAVERIRNEYLAGKDPGRPNRFFHGEPGSPAFPAWLRKLGPGFHKLAQGGLHWHAMVADHDGRRYILLRDYTDYEGDRRLPYWIVAFCLAGSLVLALALGLATTFSIVGPVSRLADAVKARMAGPGRVGEAEPPDEIARLAQAFERTFDQLEHALQRERLFTADVSHELRTPLMVISSSTELLAQEHGLPDGQRQTLQHVEHAARSMRQRLDAYLMLARGADVPDGFVRVSLRQAAQEEVGYWQALAARRNIVLELHCEAGAPGGDEDTRAVGDWGDEGLPQPLLHGILSNLIRNAIQHAGPGVRVRVEVGSRRLVVSDDGPGIAEARQEEVFAPFVRGSADASQNLGMGLSVVKRICEHQGWQIALTSGAVGGASFVVDFSPHPADAGGPRR